MKANKKLDPEKSEMKITLPLPPNLANSRMHWRVKHKKRREYFWACDAVSLALAERDDKGAWKWMAPSHARVRATIYCGGQMDHDNALSRLKWPIDWMVTAGWLVGDKPSLLSWHWPIEQVVSRKQTYRVEFELEAA